MSPGPLEQPPLTSSAASPPDLPLARATPHGRRRLRALLAAAILVPAAILAAGAWVAWRATWSEMDRELAVAAEAVAEFAQRVTEGHGRLAVRIAEELEGLPDEAIRSQRLALQERFSRYVADLPLVQDVLVVGRNGDVLARGADAPPDLAPPHRLAGAEGVPGQRIFIGTPQRYGEQPVFVIGHARDGDHGQVLVLLRANAVGARMGLFLVGEGTSAALLRNDGQIVARHPHFLEPPPPLAPGLPLPAAMAAGRSSGLLDGRTPRDQEAVRVAFRRLDGAPTLYVAVARPVPQVVGRWWRAMAPLLAIGAPAMLGVGVLGWIALRQQQAVEAALAGLEQRVAERTASLREGEERLRLAIGAGGFGTWESDLTTGITMRSPEAMQILGFAGDQAASPLKEWSSRVHPDDRERVLGAWSRLVSGRADEYRPEYRFQRPDGAWRWLEGTAAVVRRDPATGRPLRVAGTVRDITDRREEEERRELLTQEVNHRARNNLAIVQAILRLTRAQDAATYARLVEGRVAALARAQSLLAAERWTGAPFTTLLKEELLPFGGVEDPHSAGPARFVIEGPPLRLRAEAVQPLAMVLHELATNAAKHGALSTPEGRVTVTWQVDEPAGLLRIRWQETGGRAPALPQRRGVGSRVIEATIGGQLGGSVERRWPAEGLACAIAVPLARMRAGPA